MKFRGNENFSMLGKLMMVNIPTDYLVDDSICIAKYQIIIVKIRIKPFIATIQGQLATNSLLFTHQRQFYSHLASVHFGPCSLPFCLPTKNIKAVQQMLKNEPVKKVQPVLMFYSVSLV